MIPDEIAGAAACRGDGDKELVMEWVAEHPESVNDLDDDGATLLLLCVEDREFTSEQLELVRYLISLGADPNRVCTVYTEEGSAVHQAAGGKNSPHSQHVLACLLKAGADPNLAMTVRNSRLTPLASAIDAFLASDYEEWQIPIITRLLKAGASLDNCSDGLTADELIANEERVWPELALKSRHFEAAATLIRGVRAAGSWKKYCRRRAPHREILALRSLAMRGYIIPYQKRRTRSGTQGAEYKMAIAFLARLGDNGVVWNILSFWRDPDDIEDIVMDDGDVVRVCY